MKKQIKMKVFSSFLCMLLFVGFGSPLNAQDYSEYYHGYSYVANSNARIVTTIKEVGDEVHIEGLAIGYLHLGVLTVSLYYDSEVVVPIMGSGGMDILLNLTTTTSMGNYFWLNPSLPHVEHWRGVATGNVKAASPIKTTSITVSGDHLSSSGFTLSDGEILQVFKLFFRKLPGQALSENTFTYYNTLTPPIQRNEFNKVVSVRQVGVDAPPAVNVYPQMFTRRCPATIETGVPMVLGSRVILNGLADAEKLSRQTDPLQLLDWDNILSTGFIYSQSNIVLSIDDYSQKLKAEGVEYDFPAITNGVFTLGDNLFYIVTTENTANGTRVEMYETLRGLDIDATYYAQAFMTYKFQTSQSYPSLGSQVSFTPTLCNEQPLVLHDTEFSVCNTASNIQLTYDNYTENATYRIVFDAAGVEAGFLNMGNYETLPASQIEISVPYGVAPGHYVATLFVSEEGCEKEYSFSLAVSGSPVIVLTSEADLLIKEGEEFVMFVEATGATGYQWYFEGVQIEGATQFFYSDIFNTSKEGTYTVNITNGCGNQSVDFKVMQLLGIPEDISLHYSLSVYPNPYIRGSILYLSLEIPSEVEQGATAHILDVTGKEVSKHNLTQTITELKLNAAEGAYLIRVNTKSGKELLTKIIVQQ